MDDAGGTPPLTRREEISLTRTFAFTSPRSAALDERLIADAVAAMFAELRRHHAGGSVERMTHRFVRDEEFPGAWLLRTYASVRLLG